MFRKGSLRAGAKPRITDSPSVCPSVRPFVCVLTGIEPSKPYRILVLSFIAFCNFSLCETGCLEDRSFTLYLKQLVFNCLSSLKLSINLNNRSWEHNASLFFNRLNLFLCISMRGISRFGYSSRTFDVTPRVQSGFGVKLTPDFI